MRFVTNEADKITLLDLKNQTTIILSKYTAPVVVVVTPPVVVVSPASVAPVTNV